LRACVTLRLVACATIVLSGCRSPGAANSKEALALTFENDFFTGSDNNYTSGLGATWRSDARDTYPADGAVRSWIDAWSFLPELDDPAYEVYAAWSFGQEIFTPDDITVLRPPADDQPYAGVMFLDSTLFARSERATHAWNLRIGVVGPSAHAGDSQREFHEVIGEDGPRGWDTQLPDEPLLNLDYTLGYEWLRGADDERASWRIVPLAGASVGNYFTGAEAAVYGEYGWNLARSIGLLSIRRGLDPFSGDAPGASEHWSCSFYAGAGGFAVAHYMPLDGPLFRDASSVESEPLVGFVSGGFSMTHGRFTLACLATFFGPTFETQRNNTDFGTLTLSWTF